jgi:AAA15 family ATPase/GTPase
VKLKKVHVSNFRNILDTETEIQPDITCLVGKNESGKTAFLHALDRLNPQRTGAAFNVQYNYPAWLFKKHRQRGDDLEAFVPVTATFELEDGDRKAISDKFGSKVLKSKNLVVERNYANELSLDFETNEKEAIKFVFGKLSLPADFKSLQSADSFSAADEQMQEWLATGEREESDKKLVEQARQHIKFEEESFGDHVSGILEARIPGFLYFDNYSTLPYTADINRLLNPKAQLSPEEITARSLLRLGAADDEYLLNPVYEDRKRELQGVANGLRDDVLKYWTTNDKLRVDPDITMTTHDSRQGQTAVVHELKLMIWDDRHSLSIRFDEHSSGFQWFFSFLAAFSEYEFSDKPIIILLDEPALGLHARAQKDFLRFINERLAVDGRQVIFTTHSPFMVEPGRLERARLVEDKGTEHGTKVSKDVMSTDADTLFPLQGALGYDLAQHLFINEHNLVVEGTSDLTYISVISDFLKENSRTGYDDKWSVVPVGGADQIPTFVALLGNHLEVTVIVDSKSGGSQKLSQMAKDGYLANKRIIPIGIIVGKKNADIEDLFSVDDYLTLYNDAFKAKVKATDLKGTDPIVKQIARHIAVDRFDHGKPAEVFLRQRDKYLPNLSNHTLDNFQKLFEEVNKTLGS